MRVEAPQFIRRGVDILSQSGAVHFLRERAVGRRNAIDDAMFVSRIILAGAGIGGFLTEDIGLTTAAVLVYPIDAIVSEGTVMVCDTIQYAKRDPEREILNGLQRVIELWERAAQTAPPDHYQLPLPLP